MSINIGPPSVDELRPRIAVIGIGGAGGNAIANMIQAQVEGVDFIVANTDAQALNTSTAENRIQLGPDITQGLGAGSRPEVGKAAAEETVKEIEDALEGAHMCFIAAGMGGGTGTGAAPVVAKIARDKGILTVGVVTKPFTFEGSRRMRAAEVGIEELQKNVDTLIVIPNQNLFLVANPNTTFKEAFQMADEVLQQGVRSITDLMVMPGLINLDFADVRSVMREMGKAMMGTGEAEGDQRALEAAEKAIANPLLDGVSMNGAKGVIVSITGGDDMRLMEVDEAANHIRELVDKDANIIWGSAFNSSLEGKIRVSVVATGIDTDAPAEASPRPFSLKSSVDNTTPGMGSGGAQIAEKPALTRTEPAAEPDRSPSIPPLTPPESKPVETDSFSARPAATSEDKAAEAAPSPSWQMGAKKDEDNSADDELVLDASQVAGDDNGVTGKFETGAPTHAGPASSAPAAERSPAPEGNPAHNPLGTGASASAPPEQGKPQDKPPVPKAPRAGGGSTLFERMSSLSRGGSKDDEDDMDDGGDVAIPRFLGRQKNQ